MDLKKYLFLTLALCLATLALSAQEKTPAKPQPQSQASAPAGESKPPDHAASYYHFALAHMYEEMMAIYGRSEYATKAIEEYRLAIAADPSSEFLNSALAELYTRTGRIRDAVMEAQEILKRDPNNVEAHKLLGRIYLRSLSDTQSGAQSREVLKLAIEQYEALVHIQPKDVDNHLVLGGLSGMDKQGEKAEAELKAALAIDPTSEEGVTQLARLYMEEGNNGRAIEVLNSVPEAKRTSKIYATQGAIFEQLRDYKHAIAAYQRAATLDKDNIDALRGLAQNLANDGQMDAALSAYKSVQSADQQDWQSSVEISRVYRRMGKLDEAMASLKKAEAMAQESQEIPYEESIVLEAQGKFDEAVAILQKLVARSTAPAGNYTAGERNNRALFLDRLGSIYKETGRPQQALETFRKMVDLGGDEGSRGYQEVIDVYRDQKQWAEAIKTAEEAVKKYPDDKSLKLALALQLADDGKGDQGVELARSTLKGTPEDRDTLVFLSNIYGRLKRWKEAEDSLAEAEKLAGRPEEKGYIQFALGALYERQKKYDQAEQAFRQVLKQDPNNGMTLNYLGYMMADHNMHLEEALTMIKRAVEMDPQNAAYLDSLGWVYFKLGNYDEAENNLRRAVEKQPNDPTIQDHLGELYAKTGKLKLAAVHWERALDEWSKSVAADVDQQDVTRVQKKLETAKVRLAQQTGQK